MSDKKGALTMPGGTHNLTTAVELGRRGGHARARSLTADQRKASASKAAKARWKGHKKRKR